MFFVPEGKKVLVAPDPSLAIHPICDRRPHLIRPVGITGIVPVEPFPARNIGPKIVEVVQPLAQHFVEMSLAVPPVGGRHVAIDPHRIDIVRRPERIEMKELFARRPLGPPAPRRTENCCPPRAPSSVRAFPSRSAAHRLPSPPPSAHSAAPCPDSRARRPPLGPPLSPSRPPTADDS